MSVQPMRGQVYRVKLGRQDPKPYVVVSNNVRNRALDSVLAVCITTTDKSRIPTAVSLDSDDPQVGYALADDIVELVAQPMPRGMDRASRWRPGDLAVPWELHEEPVAAAVAIAGGGDVCAQPRRVPGRTVEHRGPGPVLDAFEQAVGERGLLA